MIALANTVREEKLGTAHSSENVLLFWYKNTVIKTMPSYPHLASQFYAKYENNCVLIFSVTFTLLLW